MKINAFSKSLALCLTSRSATAFTTFPSSSKSPLTFIHHFSSTSSSSSSNSSMLCTHNNNVNSIIFQRTNNKKHTTTTNNNIQRLYMSSSSSSPPPPPPQITSIGKTEMNEIIEIVESSSSSSDEESSSSSPYVIIDVRNVDEINYTGKLSPVVETLPLPYIVGNAVFDMDGEEFEETFGFSKPDFDKTVVFTCKAGIRSMHAAQFAIQAGYTSVVNYSGGADEWFR